MSTYDNIGYAQRKLDLCRRFIVLCGENYTDTQDKIYLSMARESEQDCVYWQSMQAGNTHEEACRMAYGSGDR
jgi:hypothetical protein